MGLFRWLGQRLRKKHAVKPSSILRSSALDISQSQSLLRLLSPEALQLKIEDRMKSTASQLSSQKLPHRKLSKEEHERVFKLLADLKKNLTMARAEEKIKIRQDKIDLISAALKKHELTLQSNPILFNEAYDIKLILSELEEKNRQ